MTNVYFIQVEYDSDGGSSRENTYNYVICGYELELVESALERPYFKYYFTIETKHLVARNITEKQLEKFNLSNSWEIISEMTYWQLYDIKKDYSYRQLGEEQIWMDKKKEEEWYDVHKELEEAKFNPRNPLGKLDFYRRAEEDGIEYMSYSEAIELNFEKCHMCENCGKNMTERNTRFLVEEDEETVLCVDCF